MWWNYEREKSKTKKIDDNIKNMKKENKANFNYYKTK